MSAFDPRSAAFKMLGRSNWRFDPIFLAWNFVGNGHQFGLEFRAQDVVGYHRTADAFQFKLTDRLGRYRKHEPASDVATVVVDSLKAFDPNRPIREVDSCIAAINAGLKRSISSALSLRISRRR
jgi:hypothetical protein